MLIRQMIAAGFGAASLVCAQARAQDAAMMPPELQAHDAAASPQPDAAAPDNAGSASYSTGSSGESHSETTTSSSSVSVGRARDDNADAANNSQNNSSNSVGNQIQAMAGRWQLGSSSSSAACGITLTTKKWTGDKFLATVPAGCPDGIFGANSWRVMGNHLEINMGSGQAAASFRQSGPNSWQGQVNSTGLDVYLHR